MQPIRIYIVEDDQLMAWALTQLVKSLGHHVCGLADNYNKAINEIPESHAELVITDIMLAGEGTGIDVAKYIDKHLHIPYIFHSSTISGLKEDAIALNPMDFLPKPVKKSQLYHILSKMKMLC